MAGLPLLSSPAPSATGFMSSALATVRPESVPSGSSKMKREVLWLYGCGRERMQSTESACGHFVDHVLRLATLTSTALSLKLTNLLGSSAPLVVLGVPCTACVAPLAACVAFSPSWEILASALSSVWGDCFWR